MADEEISLRFTADGADAVETTERLADAVEELDKKKVEVPIEADVEGRRDLDAFIASLEGLDNAPKTVVLAIEAASVKRELADVLAEIREVSGTDVDVSARISGANQLTAELDQIEGEIRSINGMEVAPKADSAGLDKLLDNLNELPGALGDVGQVVGKLGSAAGVGAIAAGFLAAADHAADMAISVGQTAQLTGDSLDFVSRLQSVWTSTGADVNDLQDVLLQMNGVLQTSPDLAAKLGINLDDGRGIGERFLQVVSALNTEIDGTAERSFIASQAFGEEGVRQVNAMISRVGDLDAALAATPDAKVFDQDEIDNALEMKQSITEITAELQAVAVEIGQAVIPSVDALADAFVPVLEKATALGEAIGLIGGSTTNPLGDFDVTSPLAQTNRMIGALQHFGIVGDKNIDVIFDLEKAHVEEAEAVKTSADAHESLGDMIRRNVREAQKARDAERRGLKILAEAERARRAFAESVDEGRLSLLNSADAAAALAVALGAVNRASSLDFSLMAGQTVESFDTVKTALADLDALADEGIDWSNIDLSPDDVDELRGMPDELAAVTEAIGGMRSTIQTELTAAFDTGGLDAFREKARFFRTEVGDQFQQLFEDMGASPEEARAQVQGLLDDLGLLPKDVEVVVKLTREEQARAALAAFSEVIATLPESKQVEIQTAIAQGDIDAALAILNEQLIKRGYDPIVLPVDADTKKAGDSIEDTKERHGRRGKPAVIQTDADEKGAVTAITSRILEQKYLATIDTEADTVPAHTSIRSVEKGDYDATVRVGGNRAPVDGTISSVETGNYDATVTVHGDTGPLHSSIDAEDNREIIVSVRYDRPVTPGFGGESAPTIGSARSAAPVTEVPVNVTINAAVIGSPFEVQRAVATATSKAIRLAGRRQVLLGAASR